MCASVLLPVLTQLHTPGHTEWQKGGGGGGGGQPHIGSKNIRLSSVVDGQEYSDVVLVSLAAHEQQQTQY